VNARPGDLLSRAAIAALALHLGNALPERYDVVSLGFYAIRRSSRYAQSLAAIGR
jgi:hypothetical protein